MLRPLVNEIRINVGDRRRLVLAPEARSVGASSRGRRCALIAAIIAPLPATEQRVDSAAEANRKPRGAANQILLSLNPRGLRVRNAHHHRVEHATVRAIGRLTVREGAGVAGEAVVDALDGVTDGAANSGTQRDDEPCVFGSATGRGDTARVTVRNSGRFRVVPRERL